MVVGQTRPQCGRPEIGQVTTAMASIFFELAAGTIIMTRSSRYGSLSFIE